LARQRLTSLDARPYVETCDWELDATGASAGPQAAPALAGLTPAEQAVARLVAAGRSNRETAAELYVSVKTVEFHLGHVFGKLGTRSRKNVIPRIGRSAASPGGKPRVVLGVGPGDTACAVT
jgi:DNA-binding CsgD family transcriptional regulator